MSEVIRLPHRTKCIIGQRFGKWLVLRVSSYNKHNVAMMLCECECGTIKEVNKYNLTNGLTETCGCIKSRPLKERFFSKINKTNSCWLWTGVCIKGYGQISINQKGYIASRVSWELHFGPIPKGKYVLHKCDVPSCVRPDHLFLGTRSDNSRDMHNKGRANIVYGERSPNSKLTNKQVNEIRSTNKSSIDLSKKFNVTAGTIDSVRARRTWKHI